MTMPMPPAGGGKGGGNVFQQAAGALGQAGQAAGRATGNPLAGMNLQPYMNPYTSNVINRTMGDMDRARQMTMNQTGAQATAAGAFGGSRHGVAEALTNQGFARETGNMAAGLRQNAFQNAQGAAQFDINTGLAGAGALGNLANLGFGMGQQITGQQAQMGGQQQAMQQALIDAARGRFAGFTGQPGNSLQYPLAAISGARTGQTETTSQNPGLFGWMSMLLGGM